MVNHSCLCQCRLLYNTLSDWFHKSFEAIEILARYPALGVWSLSRHEKTYLIFLESHFPPKTIGSEKRRKKNSGWFCFETQPGMALRCLVSCHPFNSLNICRQTQHFVKTEVCRDKHPFFRYFQRP